MPNDEHGWQREIVTELKIIKYVLTFIAAMLFSTCFVLAALVPKLH